LASYHATTTVFLDPNTVNLDFSSSPAGLVLKVDPSSQATPFTRTAIVSSTIQLDARSPQTRTGTSDSFVAWSDGGAARDAVMAP
jgi:hypothetical protein